MTNFVSQNNAEMKTRFCLYVLLALLPACTMAQRTTTVRGTVQRTHRTDMPVTAYVREGASTRVLATTAVGHDLTYQLEIPFEHDCEAIIDCGGWQNVHVWLCDEQLDIDFVGGDTTEVRANDPFYVDQRGGRNAELMNLVNMEQYRNFAQQTANAVAVFHSDVGTMLQKKDLSQQVNDAVMQSTAEYMRFLARHFADRPAVMVVLNRLNDPDDAGLVAETMRRLADSGEEGRRVVEAHNERLAHEKELRERAAPGHPAPDFTFQDASGRTRHLSDFLGNKVLVVDFWASWCVPCRREMQNLKQQYPRLKGRDVEFLSVSLDTKREAWEQAMKQERMAWKQGWTTDSGSSVMD